MPLAEPLGRRRPARRPRLLMLLPPSRARHRSAAASAGAETCCGETSGYQRCCCAQAGLCLLQICYGRAAGVGEEAPEHPALPPLHLACTPKARRSRVCTEAARLPAPREPRAQAKRMKPVQKSCGSNHRPAAGLLPGHDAPGSSSGWGRRGLAAARRSRCLGFPGSLFICSATA